MPVSPQQQVVSQVDRYPLIVTASSAETLSGAKPPIMNYEGRKVIITGGLGFIGSNLARSLVEVGARVTLVDSLIPEYGGNLANIADLGQSVTVNVCDVRDPYAMKHLLRDTDFVFNLAGQTSHLDSMTDPQTDLAINTGAQISLLESCRQVAPECKIVFASTRQIYGKPQYLPVDEKHPINPVDANGINKWAGESYHRLYAEVYGLNTTVLRLTNTYGPGMRVKDARQTFLGIWIRHALEGQPFLVFGDGNQLRDFNFVGDVVDALFRAGFQEKATGKIYNLGGGEVVSLNELANLLTEIVPESSFALQPFPQDKVSIDIGDYYGSISAIKEELGWEPKVTLSVGLRKTVDYYREHHEHYWETFE